MPRCLVGRSGRLAAAAAAVAIAISTLPAATAQTLPQPEVAEAGEMLPNGGFDAADFFAKPIGWATSVSGSGSAATVVYRAADKTVGPGSLEIKNVAGSGVTVAGRREVATAGVAYTLTGQAKVASGTGATVILRFYDFNKAVVGEVSYTPTSATFAPFTLTGVAPERADLVAVLISGTTATAGTTYFDDLSMRPAAPAYDPKLTGRELFLDDYRIESANDVERVVHEGTKRPDPVVRPDKPWEISAYTYGTVLKLGDAYRLYYTCYNDVAPNYYLCMAQSKDGVTWTKPSLGVYEWKGSKDNNIVQAGGGTIAYNPDAPPERRFAQLFFKGGEVNKTMGYYASFSADGIHWVDFEPGVPRLLDGDVSNVTYDPRTKRYIATIKKRMFTADTSGYDRAAFVSTSPDFVTWSNPQLGVMGDFADDGGAYAKGGLESQIYGMPVLPYESAYIGVPWVFDILNFTSGQFKTAADGPVTPQLAASRDLLRWERPVRTPLIAPSKGGAWDDGALYTASNVLVTDKEIVMYYAGFNNGHGGAEPNNPDRNVHQGMTGMATWRRDGFASLTNMSRPGVGDAGQVITKPIVLSGSELRLNADVRKGGRIVVTVLDANGTPIPGYESKDIEGDKLDQVVKFSKGEKLAELTGQTVKLKFTIVNADLYSYWVA